MNMTPKQINALIPTLSERPQVYFDLVNRLVNEGFKFNHITAEWFKETKTGDTVTVVRGRICWNDKQAWLRHPTGSDVSESHHTQKL